MAAQHNDSQTIGASYDAPVAEAAPPVVVQVFDARRELVRSVPLTAAGLQVGRLPSSDLPLAAANISRSHVQIGWNGTSATVTDLGTRNGTLLGGAPLPPREPRPWLPGQILQAGPFSLLLQVGNAPAAFPVAAGGLLAASGAGAIASAVQPAAEELMVADSGAANSLASVARIEPRFSVALAPGQEFLDIQPGQPTNVSVLLHNKSETDELRLLVAVDGLTDGWATAPLDAVTLEPEAQVVVPIAIMVPEESASTAGERSVSVRARLLGNHAETAAAQAHWSVLPFVAGQAELTPRKVSARDRASYRLRLTNSGNAPATYTLSGSDEEQLLTYTFAQPQPTVEPGEELEVPLTVDAPRRFVGRSERRGFTVRAEDAQGSAESAEAMFIHEPVVAAWFLGTTLALALLFGLLGWWLFQSQTAEAVAPRDATATAQILALADEATGTAAAAESASTAAAQAFAVTLTAVAQQPPATQTAFAIQQSTAQAGTAVAATAAEGTAVARRAATAQALSTEAAATQTTQPPVATTEVPSQTQAGATALPTSTQPIVFGTNQATATATVAATSTATASATVGAGTPSPTADEATSTPAATVARVTAFAFVVQPSTSVSGQPFAQQPQIEARDKNGARVTTFRGPVTIDFGSNTGNGTLSGTKTVNAVDGIAKFTDLSIDKIGTGYTLAAKNDTGLTVSSTPFNVIAQAGAKLVISSVNGGTSPAAGVAFKVVVQVQDANGNASNVTTNTDVKLAVKTGTGTLGGTFGGTITTGNNSVSIEGITYSKAEGGVVLSVSRISGQDLLPAESAAFSVTAGPAAKLEFTQQPGNGVAGATLAAVKVQLLDASGNPVPSAGIPVTLALGGGAGATLSGGSASTDASGGATFAGLSVNKAGTGYTLAASSGSLAGATSTSFSIQAGAPAKLVFSQQPAAVVAGAGFSVKIQAQDALGNPATLSTPLNITLARKTGNGTLGGTLSGSIAPGGTSEATISGITYTTAEGGVVITASGGGLSVDSAPFTVVAGPASKLVFTTEPPNPATAGNGFNVVLQVLDANGNPAKVTANTDVKLTLKTGTGTLGGTTSVTISANSGTGTISGITYTKAEAGVVLTAARTNGDSLTPVDTKAFTVNPGAAAKLVFSQQPQPTQPPPTGPIVAGQNFSVKIAVQDSQGNTAIASAGINITLSRKTGTGTLGGTTTGQITAGTSEGTINGITYTKAESGVVLTAAANGLASGDSGAFTVNAGTANKLVFSQPPPNPATAGAPFSIKVQVQDQFNNITTVIAGHTLELSRKTGTGTLGGTTTGALAAGTSEVTINGVTYSKVEGNVVLTAALQDNALPPVDSAAFAVVAGPPAKLVFSQQPQPTPPGPIVAGAAFSVKIAVQDINGNPATVSAAINITLSRIGGTGTLGGTTSGQIATGASETTINGITYTKAESGVQLRAAATGLTNADSAPPFTVVAGAPAKLVFSQPPPTTIISNTALTVKVQILDANDNVVNNANIAVEIVFCTVNTTICPTPVSVSTGTGVATFNLTSPGTPGSYTLTAVLPPNRTIGVAAPVTVT